MADFVADAGDERLDIQLSWTRFLAGSVCTFEAASSLSQRRSLAESRVLYVVKVVPFASAGLRERRERINWRINLGVLRRLTEHSLSLFLFQCFLAVLVLVVETREACGWIRGLRDSRL